MAYFAPYIDASGLHIPTYQDIEDLLVSNARSIFGNDIYLENDSQDFQDIALRAQAIYDTMLAIQLAYNNRSPLTAIGAGLDAIVAINGLVRQGETASTVTVNLTGTAYTLIQNGVVADINGVLWNLPASVTLDALGTATVTATCQVTGPTTALIGQVNVIVTPTFGWISVTNPGAATPGQAIETDAELRARQQISVANPSQALTTGMIGALYELDNVTSVQLYENDTSATVNYINGIQNPLGYPPHSLTFVVTGGDNNEIASSIALRKTPGAYLDGDVSVTIYDQFSVPTVVRFYRPIESMVYVEMTIKALNGYSSAVGTAIKNAVASYLDSLVPGQAVIISELWQAALAADPLPYPVFSLTLLEASTASGALSANDIPFKFNEKAIGDPLNVIINVT